MENTNPTSPRQPNPRRRRRTKMEIFKQTYLPAILVLLVVILFIVFAVGSINRSKAKREQAIEDSIAAEESREALMAAQSKEVADILRSAQALAVGYDYEAAIATIDSFSGNQYDFPDLLELRDECQTAMQSVVAWSDPTKIVHLGFNLLVEDGSRAFSDKDNGSSYQWNYLTTKEFSGILEQLYANGYVLVSLEDIITKVTLTDGTSSYSANTIYLPAGKTPILISQSHVNYYSYMTDGDGDGTPDKNGDGFASRLTVDGSGNFTCEMVNTAGETVTGAFDLVPILENFLQKHPDFSYRGARPILAVSGYDGIFGYRDEQLSQAASLIQALKDTGYTVACNTYENMAYGLIGPETMDKDLKNWREKITPVLGETTVLAYAKNSDIAVAGVSYDGEKYQLLKDAGFCFFLGFCESGAPWVELGTDYVRQGRLMVTGNSLKGTPEYFEGMFDAASVIDDCR